MKYIIIVIMVLLGGLLFVNKDKFLSMDTGGNGAAVINSVASNPNPPEWKCTGPAPQCSCLGMGSSCHCDTIYGTHTCWINGTSTSTKATYTLESDSVDNKMGTVYPSGTKKYKSGTKVTVTAKSKAGYVFEDWDGDDDSCKFKEKCVVTMDEDKYLTASFKPIVRIQRPACTKLQKENAEEAIERIYNNKNYTTEQKKNMIQNIKDSWLYCGWRF